MGINFCNIWIFCAFRRKSCITSIFYLIFLNEIYIIFGEHEYVICFIQKKGIAINKRLLHYYIQFKYFFLYIPKYLFILFAQTNNSLIVFLYSLSNSKIASNTSYNKSISFLFKLLTSEPHPLNPHSL